MLKLIRNVQVYSPVPRGKCSLLLHGEKIVDVFTPDQEQCWLHLPGLEIMDAEGLTALPAIIDQHVHIIGGGGEDGFSSSIDPLPVEECAKAGVTTLVGVLGTDSTTKTPKQLLAYAKKLNQAGLTAYCLTGSYKMPSPTVTGSVEQDIIFLPEVLGVKLALSDHRASYPTREEILRLASEARVAGMISGKAGYIHFHIGQESSGLKPLLDIVHSTSFPIRCLRPTHIHNCPEDAAEFASLGGYIDITSSVGAGSQAQLLADLAREVPEKLITVSSDANGSVPVWAPDGSVAGAGRGSLASSWQMLQELVFRHHMPLERALPFFTENVANALGLGNITGRLAPDYTADLLLVDDTLRIRTVLARGRVILQDGICTLHGYYTQS